MKKIFVFLIFIFVAITSCRNEKDIHIILADDNVDTIVFKINDSLVYNNTVPIDTSYGNRVLKLKIARTNSIEKFYIQNGNIDSTFYYNMKGVDTLAIFHIDVFTGSERDTISRFIIIDNIEMRINEE